MAKDRTPRDNVDKEENDLLKPIDVLALGSDEDPCFGKHHDLLAAECKICGDAEFCAIVKAQNLHKERLDIENKQKFKDLDEADEEMLKKRADAKELVIKYKEQGLKRIKSILRIAKEVNLTKDVVKQIYDKN